MKRIFKKGDKVVCVAFGLRPWRLFFGYIESPRYQALYTVCKVLPNGKLILEEMFIDNIWLEKETGWNPKHFIHESEVKDINDL